MPIITISMKEGRTKDQKAQLANNGDCGQGSWDHTRKSQHRNQ